MFDPALNLRSIVDQPAPYTAPDGGVDYLAQDGHASDSRVEERAAEQLKREHEVEALDILCRLHARGI